MISRLKNHFKILVIGAGRGGTSLVGSLLDSHPKITLGLEEHSYDYLVGAGEEAQGLPAEKRLALFLGKCRKSAFESGGIWGNKVTTEQLDYLLSDPAQEEERQLVLKRLLAKRKVVFVCRDGRTCVHSKMLRADLDYNTAVDHWKKSVDWLKFLQRQSSLQLYTVRFEELLQHPQEQLEGICQFLGLSYAPEMLKGTASNRIAKMYRQSAINTQKAIVPPEAMAYTNDLKAELEYLGYY